MTNVSHRIVAGFLAFFGACSIALAHDDLAGREKEFRYGYLYGYVKAIRDTKEGTVMCTKNVPPAEIIKTIGAYNKTKGISSETALSDIHITEALSTKYKCPTKQN